MLYCYIEKELLYTSMKTQLGTINAAMRTRNNAETITSQFAEVKHVQSVKKHACFDETRTSPQEKSYSCLCTNISC